MVRLRVLGGTDLRDDGGRDLSALIAQPKRLALLTYLALARPRGFHRREVLLSLFWPLSDRATARNSLRQALHYLRHSLGDGVIVSRGENEVRVDEGLLWSDASAFLSSLDAGDSVEALALYRGDLMPGATIADAPEFNRWLDNERDHLRSRVEGALGAIAVAAEDRGDHSSAVEARRRNAALEPLSARFALALMRTLAEGGDRAGAIQHAAAFTRHIHDELGVDGDKGVTAFAAELRGGVRSLRADVTPDGSRRTDAPGTAAKAGAQSRLVVLPFAVHGEAAHQYLEQGMVDLLSRSLDGADTLRVVDPYAVIGLTSRSATGPADPELGREVGRRFGAELFVLGSVVGAHGRLQVFATLYHVEKGRLVAAEANVADEGALFEIVEDLTRQLLIGQLSSAQRLTRIAATLTPSIAALKAYLTGESHYRRGCFVPAREALERAISHDASFALAWYRLGHVALWQQQPEIAVECTQRAMAVSERMHPQDRVLLEAFVGQLQGRFDAAERLYRSVLSDNPDNVEAALGLGLLLIAFNPMRGRSAAESLLPLARILEVDPENSAARMHTAYVLAKEGKYAEHRSSVRQWDDDNEYGIYPRAMHALLAGSPEEAEAVLLELRRADDLVVQEAVRYVARLTHNLAGAQRVARLLTEPSRPRHTIALGYLLVSQLAAGLGRHREAVDSLSGFRRFYPEAACWHEGLVAAMPFLPVPSDQIDAMRKALTEMDSGSATTAEEIRFVAVHEGLQDAIRLYVLGHLHAKSGAFDAALATAEQLAGLAVPAERSRQVEDWSRGVQAHVAWRQGRPLHALGLLEGAQLSITYAQRFSHSPFVAQDLERYLRAQVLELVGRDEDAQMWYDCVSSDFVHEVVFLAPSYLRRAQIHDRRGDYGLARDFYQRFIALWRNADPEEAPVVADAERRLIRLGAHASRQTPSAARLN